jgi:hypothetical protein
MEWVNTRRTETVVVVVVVAAMAACASGSQEIGHLEAHDAASEVRNVIPATAAAILEQADQFELLSLNPDQQQKQAKGDFHGFRVLGTAVISDTETRKKLVSTFKKAVAENHGTAAACFNPRHGIRVIRNEKRADFVICFECNQVQVFGEVQGTFLITSSAQPLFDSVLRSSGVHRGKRRNSSA